MHTNLIALQVVIGLRPNGHADHPDWTTLPVIQGGASIHDHVFIGGWKYDKSSGHADDTPGSPAGSQLGMLIVSAQFATEAVAAFPALVSTLNEAQAQAFWDDKAHGHLADNLMNNETLLALNTELQLKEALAQDTTVIKAKIAKALDPNDSEPGVKKNHDRRWADAKARHGFSLAP